MRIRKSSWHYRWVCWLHRDELAGGVLPPMTMCSYWSDVIGSAIFLAVGFGLLAALAIIASPVLFPLWLSGAFEYKPPARMREPAEPRTKAGRWWRRNVCPVIEFVDGDGE